MNTAPHVRAAAQAAVAQLRELTGVLAAVVATADGFDVASASDRGDDAARIAAMASSISALGSVVTQESALGACQQVTVGTTGGFAHVRGVARADGDLVLSIIADKSAVLAQVAYTAALQVRRMEAA